MAGDALHGLIIGALHRVIDRELEEEAEVRDEIKLRGTWWAGTEIWTLRRQVAGLRRRVAELERAGDA